MTSAFYRSTSVGSFGSLGSARFASASGAAFKPPSPAYKSPSFAYKSPSPAYGSAASYGSAVSGSAAPFGLGASAASFESAASGAAASVYVPGPRRGPVLRPEEHKLNVDPNPTVIRKKPTERAKYTQNVSLKYLKPPPPPKPGDITIEQEPDVQVPPAPPLHVRQKPSQPIKPAPAIVRERPPKPPAPIGPKHITIPGKVLPPPPRQVITERLPPLPPMPQDVIIERWLGYDRRTRNVVFRPAAPIAPLPAPKNVLIEWEPIEADVCKKFNFLGVECADPASYAAQHGGSLVDGRQLPADADHFQVPNGEKLAIHSNPDETPVLTGDIQALRLVDLNCHGLDEYRSQI